MGGNGRLLIRAGAGRCKTLTTPHRTNQGLSWLLVKSTSKISSLVSDVNFGV